jgi:HTH-type transcriptional regulator, transcriptional repressor of NAD biosynthesis genes
MTGKFRRGLVIGKFHPPHRGHKYLIETARSQCEQVTVIVCWRKSQEIPGVLRAQWIQQIHPDVQVKLLDDDRLMDDDSEGWARNTVEVLGFVPDAVFTSEAYGDPYASFMGAVHVLVDRDRTHVPISATQVRRDPARHAGFLEPCVRAYYAKRVVVLGAESTGTTTLARDLAKHYHTVWVPEYGRLYSEGKLFGDANAAWRTDEFVAIARAQAELEDTLAQASNGLVICDTDSFATSLWHERYLGTRSAAVEQIASGRAHDLYILTGDEIPFEQDGMRDGEHIRGAMHKRFIERLAEEGKRYVLVTGTREQRLADAIRAIDEVLHPGG